MEETLQQSSSQDRYRDHPRGVCVLHDHSLLIGVEVVVVVAASADVPLLFELLIVLAGTESSSVGTAAGTGAAAATTSGTMAGACALTGDSSSSSSIPKLGTNSMAFTFRDENLDLRSSLLSCWAIVDGFATMSALGTQQNLENACSLENGHVKLFYPFVVARLDSLRVCLCVRFSRTGRVQTFVRVFRD